MPRLWPEEKIAELVSQAQTLGRASATLNSAREASLFRFAIYSWRQTTKQGLDLGITIEANTVVLVKHAKPEVRLNIA